MAGRRLVVVLHFIDLRDVERRLQIGVLVIERLVRQRDDHRDLLEPFNVSGFRNDLRRSAPFHSDRFQHVMRAELEVNPDENCRDGESNDGESAEPGHTLLLRKTIVGSETIYSDSIQTSTLPKGSTSLFVRCFELIRTDGPPQ